MLPALLPYLPSIIGGGVGLLSSLFGNKPQQQTQTTSYDPASQNYLNFVRGQAQNLYGGLPSAPQVDPSLLSAIQALQGVQGMTPFAMGGLTGSDPSALNQSLSAMLPLMNLLQGRAGAQADLQSAQYGQFAGSSDRAALGKANAMTNAGATLGYQNYQDTMTRLLSMLNMGMGASGSLANIGQFLTQYPLQYAQGRGGLLQLPNGMPGASMTSTTTQPNQTNPLLALLGGAVAGSGFSMPGTPKPSAPAKPMLPVGTGAGRMV